MEGVAVLGGPHTEAPARPGHPWSGQEAAASLGKFAEKRLIEPSRTLVLSAAMQEEVAHLARSGYKTLAVDTDARQLKSLGDGIRRDGLSVGLVTADFLAMAPSLCGPVELVVDRLFVHGLPPARWADWAEKIGRVLPEGGRLAGLFYIGRTVEGPPYPMTLDVLRRLISRLFTTAVLEPVGPSEPGRAQAYRGLFLRK